MRAEQQVRELIEGSSKRALTLEGIADELGEPEPRVSRLLERAVDAGDLKTKEVDGVRIWWVSR